MITSIDGAALSRMLVHGAACINAQKQGVNDLNVFPVPDGDTGTNMSMTMAAAAAELNKKKPGTVSDAAAVTASALLRGARGNSGVILSLLFRGFSKSLKDKTTMDGRDFAIALDWGVAAAYKAVMKPAEGTILTVSRLTAARAAEAAREDASPDFVLENAIRAGQEALAQTVEQNPVLKKAGVVDAGGMGFLIILQGMLDELHGLPMPAVEGDDTQAKADFSTLTDEEITFTFDTVFIVRKTGGLPLSLFREYLNSIGDSLVIGEDDDAFKVHVHTDIPGAALMEAQKYGTLELAKIENMRTQYEDMAAGRTPQSTDDLDMEDAAVERAAEPVSAPPEKKFGFVSVCAGDGLAQVFSDLGAEGVVSGGQTMNPSTEDILNEVRKIPAQVVYVLPNNKNIIMAAQQVIPLVEDKKVVVIPTATVPQGISAMLAVDFDGEEAANTAAMEAAMGQVHTSQITYAARSSDFDGFQITEGDYLALSENQLFGTDKDLDTLLEQLARAEHQQNAQFITIFYGEDVTESDGERALKIFRDACPKAEVSLLPGGQPVYYYLISAE